MAKKDRKYMGKDFVALRDELLNHAKIYFPNNIQDFSEASLGGLFLEMAAYIGDNMSFYLDHQFNELNVETAVETVNLERHLRSAGVKISGNSPATLFVKFFIQVPATSVSGGDYAPLASALPVIKKGTIVNTSAGIQFELTHDVDFSATDSKGELVAEIVSSNRRGGIPESFFLNATGLCVSGKTVTETFSIPDTDVPFRTVTLNNPSVNSIDRVFDSSGNEYYEVESLSQDTVFRAVNNPNSADDGVRMNVQALSAHRRYITEVSLNTRTTTIRFGSGTPTSADEDIIPDPSNLAMPLYGRTNIQKFSLDPNSILKSNTLGVYPKNTVISVVYRHGGGRSHNVLPDTATGVSGLKIAFVDGVSQTHRTLVENSVGVRNEGPGAGGADAPTLNDLRSIVPAARNMQNRIVTKEDLLARIYTLPAEFGRIYRASVLPNPNNPLASSLHVLSRDSAGKLTQAPDTLKQNLSTYLNEFRLISNSLDILDAEVINFRVVVSVVPSPGSNPSDVANNIINRLTKIYRIENFQLGQNIIEADAINVVLNTPGVQAMPSIDFINRTGTVAGRTYSGYSYSFSNAKTKGSFACPQNAIFEMRHPNFDITVNI